MKKWRRNHSVWKSSFTIRMKTNLGMDGPQCYLWQASLVCQTGRHFSFYCLTDCPFVCRRRILALSILMIKMIKIIILRSASTGSSHKNELKWVERPPYVLSNRVSCKSILQERNRQEKSAFSSKIYLCRFFDEKVNNWMKYDTNF